MAFTQMFCFKRYLSIDMPLHPPQHGAQPRERQPERRMSRSRFTRTIHHRFTTAQQPQPCLEPAAHVFEERAGGGQILLQHLAGEFDLGLCLVFGAKALEGSAFVGERNMDPMKLGEMPGQPLARNNPVRIHHLNIEGGA